MIPTEVKIGCATWNVVYVRSDEEFGECRPKTHELVIVEGQAEREEEETLVHEILHACTKLVGIDSDKKYTEDEWVNRLSPIVHTVLRENGWWHSPAER